MRIAQIAPLTESVPPRLTPRPVAPGYLGFLGRISPEKRPDRAIRIAHRAGIPLKIAAKVDRTDDTYFQAMVRPLIDGHNVSKRWLAARQ